MTFKMFGKLAAMVLVGGALVGCIDAKVDVALTSETTAKVTMTQIMGADFYSMIKMSAEQATSPADEEFCVDGDLTENADGSATCIIVDEGKFADLDMGSDEETITFTPAGAGLVRVSLPTADMKAEIGANEAMDEETKKMIEAFFAGRGVTLTFGGAEVTKSNMKIADDKASAQATIKFLDLINGATDLPDEYYAIVRVP